MTLVYIPRLIESAEQAEALPVGTVAIREDHYAREKVGPVSWIAPWGTVRRRDAMLGWSALVPIEAEEQYGARDIRYGTVWVSTHPRADRSEAEGEIQRSSQYDDRDRLATRLVTPWEEA